MVGARRQTSGRTVPVALVVADQTDPANVPLIPAERRPQELEHEFRRLFGAVLAGPDGDDVRVVLVAGGRGGLGVFKHRGPAGGGPVLRPPLAVARPPPGAAGGGRGGPRPPPPPAADRRGGGL